MEVIHKLTYPNGKIYVARDVTDSINLFGSAGSEIIAADISREQRRDFSTRREILWESDATSDREVGDKEVELIRKYRVNDPEIGHNRLPKLQE